MSERTSRSIKTAVLLLVIGAVFLYKNLGGDMPFLTIVWYLLILLFIWSGLKRMFLYFRQIGSPEDQSAKIPSLAFGVLWLTIGVLLLLSTMGVITDLFVLFGKWWPALLILMGVAKLVDAGLFQRRVSLRGGEVVCVIFLILIGLTVQQLSEVQFGNFPVFIHAKKLFQDSYHFTKEENILLEDAQALHFSHQNGRIELIQSESEEILVRLDKEIFARSEEKARDIEKVVTIVSAVAEGTLKLKLSEYQDQTDSVAVRVRLAVPRGVMLKVTNYNDDISCKGLANPVNLSTTNGDITIRTHEGALDLSGTNIDMSLGDVTGDAKINGKDLDVTIRKLVGSLNLENRRGRVTLEEISGNSNLVINHGSLSGNDIHGNLEINGPHTTIKLRTIFGTVRVDNSYEVLSVKEMEGDLILTAKSSKIDLQDIAGAVSGKAVKGKFKARNIKKSVTLELERCACNLDMILGPVKISNTGKDIYLEDVEGAIDVSNENGSIIFKNVPEDPAVKVKAFTERGDILINLVKFPQQRKIFLSAVKGFFTSEFPKGALKQETIDNGLAWRNFSGALEQADLVCRVTHGKISLKKKKSSETKRTIRISYED